MKLAGPMSLAVLLALGCGGHSEQPPGPNHEDGDTFGPVTTVVDGIVDMSGFGGDDQRACWNDTEESIRCVAKGASTPTIALAKVTPVASVRELQFAGGTLFYSTVAYSSPEGEAKDYIARVEDGVATKLVELPRFGGFAIANDTVFGLSDGLKSVSARSASTAPTVVSDKAGVHIAADASHVAWALLETVHLMPALGGTVIDVNLGGPVTALSFADGQLFAALGGKSGGSLVRVDPASGEVKGVLASTVLAGDATVVRVSGTTAFVLTALHDTLTMSVCRFQSAACVVVDRRPVVDGTVPFDIVVRSDEVLWAAGGRILRVTRSI